MFDKNRIKQDFSNVAMQYDKHATLQQHVLRELVAMAKPLLLPAGKVLDAGCGTGQLASLLPDYAITGADIAHAMCRRAASHGLTTVGATMEALPFADSVFDIVFSSLALQWVEHPDKAISELERVLRKGGVLALTTFGDGTLHELKESFTAGDRYPHVSEFVPEAGFEHVETVTEYFPDLSSIMHHLKAIGARNKLMRRSKSLMTARQLAVVKNYYREHFGTENGLPVTWKVLYSVKIN